MINVNAIIQQAMQNSNLMQNPIAKNAIEMYQRGDTQGINELANNLCKERGINVDDITKRIKSQFGIN